MPDLFLEFLQKKKINAQSFQQQRPEEWERLTSEFDAMGEKSFDQRKKFLIDSWRLAFPLPKPEES